MYRRRYAHRPSFIARPPISKDAHYLPNLAVLILPYINQILALLLRIQEPQLFAYGLGLKSEPETNLAVRRDEGMGISIFPDVRAVDCRVIAKTASPR